jgi:hypothetical protein
MYRSELSLQTFLYVQELYIRQIRRTLKGARGSVVLKALCYKRKVAGSRPVEENF